MKIDISTKQRNVSVVWYLDKTERTIKTRETQEVTIQKKKLSLSFFSDLAKIAYAQLRPQSQHRTIVFTTASLTKMKQWGLSENKVKDVVLHGEYVKENMMVKKYNGYEIGCIAKYSQETKTYLILSAWKRKRR